MKRIGLVGGLSWVSTQAYYQMINEKAAEHLGPKHSAQLAVVNVDIGAFDQFLRQGQSQQAIELLQKAACDLERAGSDLVILCSNGVHRYFDEVKDAISLPMIHIADAIAAPIKKLGFKKVGVLGVRRTMEDGFYQKRLMQHGIAAIVPGEADRNQVHEIIYEQLIQGKFTTESRNVYLKIMEKMMVAGAEAIVLGCTEIPLLIQRKDTAIPLIETTRLHCDAAVKFAFK